MTNRWRVQTCRILGIVFLASPLLVPTRLAAQTRAASWRQGPRRIDYPPVLLKYHLFGQVDASFVVDERGRIDTTTFDIVAPSSSPIFASTVKQAIVAGEAQPGSVDGHPTKQRLRHVFIFAPSDHVACSGVPLPRTPEVTVVCAPETR